MSWSMQSWETGKEKPWESLGVSLLREHTLICLLPIPTSQEDQSSTQIVHTADQASRQTSVASGVVQQMGKGYSQWKEIAGTDLREHFEAGFRRQVRSCMTRNSTWF